MAKRPKDAPRSLVEAQQHYADALRRRERRNALVVLAIGLLVVGGAALAIGRSSGGPDAATIDRGRSGDGGIVKPKRRSLRPVLGRAQGSGAGRLRDGQRAARRFWILPFEMVGAPGVVGAKATRRVAGKRLRWLRGALALALRAKLGGLRALVAADAPAGRGATTAADLTRMATDAQQAGVALIIGGGVRLAAGQLRIDAQLVHSRTPGLRKRVSAAGPLGTPLRVIDDLARRLASTLRINSEDRAVSHALSRWPTRKREWLETLGRARDALLGAGHAPSPARAAQLFRRVIAVDKTIAEAHYGLARALSGGAELDRLRLDATARRRSGRDERVSSALEKAIAARPGYHAALFALATLRAATGDHERAADLYGRALAASPDDARALHGMALSQAALKRDGKARRFIDRALRLDGGDADARSTRALLIAVGKGAGHRALPDTSAALTGQGDKARSGLVRAYAQLRAGRAPACLLTITRARRALAPTRRAQYAELVDTLEAVCHLAAGHKAQAKRIVARLAKIKTSAAKYARRLQQPWRRVFADLQRRLGTLR